MPLPVKYFNYTMQGAPVLSNGNGNLTALLDACLVNGFNLKTINTLTSAGGIATANVVAGAQYDVGAVILVEGADQPEYNGEVRVLSRDSYNFTYAISGSPASPATGTISAKNAPLGWEIAFSGTNKRAYRSLNPLSNRPFLRVDDSLTPGYDNSYAKKGKVTMAASMTDIDTFGPGPRAPFEPNNPWRNEGSGGTGTSMYDGWYKWYYAKYPGNSSDTQSVSAGAREWCLIGDDRGFYLINAHWPGYYPTGKCFTDFESYRPNDGYNTLLTACANFSQASTVKSAYSFPSNGSEDWQHRFARTNDSTGKLILRPHHQAGDPVPGAFASLGLTSSSTMSSGYDTGITWPNAADYSTILHPLLLKEGDSLRGRMPGIHFVHASSPGFSDFSQISNVIGYPGRTFLMARLGTGNTVDHIGDFGAMYAFDITGPWW